MSTDDALTSGAYESRGRVAAMPAGSFLLCTVVYRKEVRCGLSQRLSNSVTGDKWRGLKLLDTKSVFRVEETMKIGL